MVVAPFPQNKQIITHIHTHTHTLWQPSQLSKSKGFYFTLFSWAMIIQVFRPSGNPCGRFIYTHEKLLHVNSPAHIQHTHSLSHKWIVVFPIYMLTVKLT